MNRYVFLLSLLWRHAAYYLVGGAMVGLTLWMTMAIPRYLQEAVDILGGDPDPGGGAFLEFLQGGILPAVAVLTSRAA